MRHSIVVKFLAMLLSALSLVAAIGGAYGIVAMESAGLYVRGVNELQEPEMLSIAKEVARSYATYYAVETYSNLSYKQRENRYSNPADRGDADYWTVKLQVGNKVLVDPGSVYGYDLVKEYTYVPEYPLIYSEKDLLDETLEIPEGYLYVNEETSWKGTSIITDYVYYYEAPEYTVTVYLQEEALENSAIHILTSLYPYRYSFIALLALGLVLFSAGMVYLCWVAGRSRDGKIRPGGLNRIPLDLYAIGVILGIYALLQLFSTLQQWVEYEGPHLGNLSLVGVNLLAIILLSMGWVFAFCAQVKLKNGYLWHRSALGFCIVRLSRLIRRCLRAAGTMLRLLPVIWQWLLTAAVIAGMILLTYLMAVNTQSVIWHTLYWLSIGGCAILICYCGYAFGSLLSGAKKMTRDDLSHKISTKYLAGPFLDCANELNTLSETAMISAEKQLRSEQMKSELITNVTHDIKTPLTSIINFVDLLRKPHTPQEDAQYLDVLSRQSARMKKLIEDLIELSKANSGSLTVNPVRMDAVETINQALGELSDKLEAAQLTPVFFPPEEAVFMKADGRLVWRVLSNLLGNAIKYALPGTRLYLELYRFEDTVTVSLKNISRAPLNLSGEELMERFVRGDASRNSEGSGLGLNIARSLMEVQGGNLQLLVDGDLFKVTLTFPAG